MADNVLFESGDDLDEANLLGAHAKTNQTDYVVRGLGFAADHTAETLDVGSGAAIIETSNNEAYILETIDARSGLAFATTTGTNYVFLSVDDTTDANDISITIKDADTPPSDPSLKIGEVDASADTSTELNRDPSITAAEADITNETYIEASRSSDNSGNSKGDWVNMVDSESVDNRGEFNASQQYVPDKSGRVKYSGVVSITGADQDRIQVRIQDVTDVSSATTPSINRDALNGTEDQINFTVYADVTAGNSHEIQVVNLGSSFTVKGTVTHFVLEKVVVHP